MSTSLDSLQSTLLPPKKLLFRLQKVNIQAKQWEYCHRLLENLTLLLMVNSLLFNLQPRLPRCLDFVYIPAKASPLRNYNLPREDSRKDHLYRLGLEVLPVALIRLWIKLNYNQ